MTNMKTSYYSIRLYLLTSLLLLACHPAKEGAFRGKSGTLQSSSGLRPERPRNIVLMIGDGMGMGQITAGMYSNNNYLNLERCSHVGLQKTHAADDLITDSASAASAFSIGHKTKNEYLGIDSARYWHPTILEDAEGKGLATGIIVTSSIVHATPAAFFAHQTSRHHYEAIATDLLKVDVDFLVGGGKKYFDRRNTDSLNLIETLKQNGYWVTDYFEQDYEQWILPKVKKLVYFSADGDPLPASGGRSYLPKATRDGLNFLDQQSDKGFFLMVEGSQIDWGGHANNTDYVVSEMLDFDEAVRQALDFAEKDRQTLVIITADHEAGGMTITSGKKSGKLGASFSTTKHTAELIPVFAYGPGAERFSGIYENTAIYDKMYELLFNVKPPRKPGSLNK